MKTLIALLLFTTSVLAQDTSKSGIPLIKGRTYIPRAIMDTAWVNGTNLGATSTLGLGVISVLENGAIGNGVANDSLAFAQTFTAALATGKKIIVPSGRYRIPYGIDWPGNIETEGVGGDAELFTDVNDVDLIRINGIASPTVTNITVTSLKGTRTLTVASASGFSIGDTVLIKSNGISYLDGTDTTTFGNPITGAVRAADTNKTIITSVGHRFYAGEEVIIAGNEVVGIEMLHGWHGIYVDSVLSSSQVRVTRKSNGTYVSGGQIASASGNNDERNVITNISGTTITLLNTLYDDYHSSTYRIPTMRKINVASNIKFKGITFRNLDRSGGAYPFTGNTIYMRYANTVNFEDCNFKIALDAIAYYSDNIHYINCSMESTQVSFQHSKFSGVSGGAARQVTFSAWKNSDEVTFTHIKVRQVPGGQSAFYMSGWANSCEASYNNIELEGGGAPYYTILFDWRSDFGKAIGNTIIGHNSPDFLGISGTGGVGYKITNNTIVGCATGIQAEVTRGSIYSDNTLVFADTSVPVDGTALFLMDAARGDTIWGNQIVHNSMFGNGTVGGLHFVTSGNGRILSNIISDNTISNTRRGIFIQESDSSAGFGFDYNTLRDNRIFGSAVTNYDWEMTARHNITSNNQSMVSAFGQTPFADAYTVASADTISPLMWADLMRVTGSADVSYIKPGHKDKVIMLKFDSVLVVQDGKNLILNGSLQTTIGAVLTLVCDGVNWVELSREVAPAAISALPYTYQQSSQIRTVVPLTTVLDGDGVDDLLIDAGTASATFFGAGTMELWLYLKDTTVSARVIFERNGHEEFGVQDTIASKLLIMPSQRILGSHRGYNNVARLDTGVISTTVIPLEQWTHIAWSWDGTDQTIFINGILDATKASSDTGSSGITEPGNRADLFRANAKYAEFRIWSKARTSGEILADYKLHLTGLEADLNAYFRFDDTVHTATEVAVINQKTGIRAPDQLIGSTLPLFDRITVGRFEGEISLDFVSPNATVDTLTVNSSINFDGGGSAGDVLTRDADGNALWQTVNLPTQEGYQALLDTVNEHKNQNTQQSDTLWVHRTDIDSLFVVVGDLIDSLAIFLALMDEQELSKQAYADTNTWDATQAWVLSQGFGTGGGDIDGVTAGNGLQGGGTSGSVTLNATPKALGGLIVTDDSLEVDSTKYFSTYAGSLKLPLAGGTMTGNLGINVAPELALDVNGYIKATSGFVGQYAVGFKIFGDWNQGIQMLVVPGTGDVLIGTTTDDGVHKLQVTGDVVATDTINAPYISATTSLSVGGVAVPSTSSTNTLTNKRITARYGSTTSSATPTINTDNVDVYELTAQAADITSMTTNLSGTPTTDQVFHIIIVGTAARAITWGASFEASTVALPTTTVSTNRLDVYFVWNSSSSKWRCGGTW